MEFSLDGGIREGSSRRTNKKENMSNLNSTAVSDKKKKKRKLEHTNLPWV
jgi:hypothetical protein